MSVRKEVLYGNTKALFQKPVKRVWFKLNPLLEKTSLFAQDSEESKFTLPLKSVVICEKILEDDTAFQTGCTEVDFWDYLNLGRWKDWCTVRVFEGQLLDWLVEGLHALQESGTIKTCQTRVFTENIRITKNPFKMSETREVTEIPETLRLSYTYYGKRTEPIENMFSGSTAYPASTMSGPDLEDFICSELGRFTGSDPILPRRESNASEGQEVQLSSTATFNGGSKPDIANIASVSSTASRHDKELDFSIASRNEKEVGSSRNSRIDKEMASSTDSRSDKEEPSSGSRNDKEEPNTVLRNDKEGLSTGFSNDGDGSSEARRVNLSSEADDSIRYWNNGTTFSQRYSRLDSDSDLGYVKDIGLSILTPQRLPLTDNMPIQFTPYRQWAKLREARRLPRNCSADSSTLEERRYRLPSIYDLPKFICSRTIRTPPEREEVPITQEEEEEEEEEEKVDPFSEESSLWLTSTLKHMFKNTDERVLDRLRRRKAELIEERERNIVKGDNFIPGQHLSEMFRIIQEYDTATMEFPILKRCLPVPTFEQFLFQLLDEEDFDPRFRVNKRRVRKIAKRYNLKEEKNDPALAQAMKEEQEKCPTSLLEDLRIMFLPRYAKGGARRRRSPRKENQEKKKTKLVKGPKKSVLRKEGHNANKEGNVAHKEGSSFQKEGRVIHKEAHNHDSGKKAKAGGTVGSATQTVESVHGHGQTHHASNYDGTFVDTVVGITDCPTFRHSLVGITENEEGSDAQSTTHQSTQNPNGQRGSPKITITTPGLTDRHIQGIRVDSRQTGMSPGNTPSRGQGASHPGTPSVIVQQGRCQETPSDRGQSSSSRQSAGSYTPDVIGHTPNHHESQHLKDGFESNSPKTIGNERLAVGGVRAVKSKKSGIAPPPSPTPQPYESGTEGGLAGNYKAKPNRHKGDGKATLRAGSGVSLSKSPMNLSKGSARKGGSAANLSRGKLSVDTNRSSRPLDTAETIPTKGSNGTYDRDQDESPGGDYGIPEIFDATKINRRYSFDRMRSKRKGRASPTFKDILKKYMKVQKAVGVFKRNNAPKTKLAKLRGGKNPFQMSPSPSPEQTTGLAFFSKALGKKRRMAVVPVSVVVPDFQHLGPTEFRRKLMKALGEFVVRKEQVISSYKHRNITCITFTRSHIFL